METHGIGPWRATYTGRKFYIMDPVPEDVDITDIAHSLSLQCRFGGHCKEFYSVAQHSVAVANMVPDGFKLMALLHDAHEAYTGDVVRPLKRALAGYECIAENIQNAINKRFGLDWETRKAGHDIVKMADEKMLFAERRDLMVDQVEKWEPDVKGGDEDLPPEIIQPWRPGLAEALFLTMYSDLTGALNTFGLPDGVEE